VILEVAPPPPPTTPTALAASATSSSEIRLTWESKPPAQTGVKTEASSGDSPFYEIGELPCGATSFVNTGLRNPADIRYRVRAYNIGGYSEYPNVAGLGSVAADCH
jgi:uncharacterized protein